MHKSDTDECGFKKCHGDFILIASSSDVAKERNIVENALKDEITELGESVSVYSFDTEHEGTVMDQRTTMQRNIPRPSIPNCRGVVYIVGERFGLPLEKGFDPVHLGKSISWTKADRFPLVLDWPDDYDTRRELLEQGAFPLTGGLFEFLAARGAVEKGETLGKPVLFILLAESAVSTGGGMIVLNKYRWFSEQTIELPQMMKRRWEDETYSPEIMAVHNFLHALFRERIDQNPTLDEENIRNYSRNFIRHNVFGLEKELRNPYRALSYYDVCHGYFYGRNAFVKSILRSFEDRLNKPEENSACFISGPSGSGKSSVLRAGVIRHLQDARHRSRNFCAILRPDMFRDAAGGELAVIDTVLDALELQQSPSLPGAVRASIRHAGASASMDAARALLDALKKQKAPPERFILAFDQFEEVVDELSTTSRQEYWQPLLRFIETLATDQIFGLIFTLESSRKTQLRSLIRDEKLCEPYRSAFEEKLSDAGDTFLKEVIWRPFEKTRYPLDESVVTELLRQFEQLREEDARAARNSVLPLLSLKLHALWDHVAANFEPVTDPVIGGGEMVPREDKINLDSLKSSGWDPSFGSVLNDLATKAWQRANVGAPEGFNLSSFLQPLVGVAGKTGNVQLTTTQRKAPYNTEKKVIESFRHYRLLIDVGDGLVRLIHQAVLDYWDAARSWLEANHEFLEREAVMRTEARNWDAQDRPPVRSRGKSLQQKIDTAARILSEYLRSWAFENSEPRDDDYVLRDYCLLLFRKSETPRRFIYQESEPYGSFVSLAASYGLNDLLQKYYENDQSALSEIISPKKTAAPPLNQAAWAHLSTVVYLLEKVNDTIGRSKSGYPAITSAIAGGRRDIYQVLMQAAQTKSNGTPVETLLANPENNTLVHTAAHYGQTEILRDLVEHHGFSADAENKLGYSPIHSCCISDALSAFDYLRSMSQFGKLKDKFGNSCLHIVANNGGKRILDRILSLPEGTNLVQQTNKYGKTPIGLAARNRQADCVTALQKFDADPDAGSVTAIHLLFWGVPKAIIGESEEPLLEKPPYELSRGLFAILHSKGGISNEKKGVDLLTSYDFEPELAKTIVSTLKSKFVDEKGRLDLESAVTRMTRTDNVADTDYDEDRAVATLRALLASPKIDPNRPNQYGRRPIGIVVSVRPLLLELLKDSRVDLSLPIDKSGEKGIYLAARVGAWSAVRRYLEKHGFPEGAGADNDGNTFLHHLTARRAPPDLVLENISHVSSEQINARNIRGRTPLHRAMRNKFWNVAEQMVETGLVDLHAGNRALDWELLIALFLSAPDALVSKIAEALGPEKLAQPDEDGWTILHHVAAANAKPQMKKLTENVDVSSLWNRMDKADRRPADLAGPQISSFVPEEYPTEAWSGAITWESGLDWKPVTDVRRKNAIAVLSLEDVRKRQLIVMQAALPFYPRKRIVRVELQTDDKRRSTYYLLASGSKLTQLDGTSHPVHTFNARHLKLSEENARQYLHYFCFFVRGEEGPFFILEDGAAPILSDETSAEDREKIKTFAMPTFSRGTGDDQYSFVARVFYSNAIFSSYFKVLKTGMIEMEDDCPVAADLSGQVDMPVS